MTAQPQGEPAFPLAAVLYLALASFGSALSLRVTDAQLPRLAAELGVSLGGASYVVTTFSIAYGVSQLFFGPLGDRHGKYLVVSWACMACAATAAACALAPVESGRVRDVAVFFAAIIAFAVLVGLLGLYVGIALYLPAVTLWKAKLRPARAALLGLGAALFFYVCFEYAFKLPLPKGPLLNLFGIY